MWSLCFTNVEKLDHMIYIYFSFCRNCQIVPVTFLLTVFFLNQTNIWHFQTLNVCQSAYKILLHYHLMNIFLNSRAIENFVNSLLTIQAIIFITHSSISFLFFFFLLFLIEVQKFSYFLESNSFFCFIYCNTIQ